MSWLTWPVRVVVFLFWFAWAVITANLAVVRDVVTPGQGSTPGVVELRTRCGSNLEVTLLGVIITLTPGTLTMGTHIAGDGTRMLYVHGMYNTSAEDLAGDLEHMESWLLWAMRRKGMGT
ncbi:Na+/H+ antiporter subunit E [Pseudactinotalea sp. Z1748]|uniref:Na+/H+ antiporter subunit E n=1 Tax=Pseudactinotalea sp. Z1748 TaxID=3413027 RepID=UPI003C7EC9B9